MLLVLGRSNNSADLIPAAAENAASRRTAMAGGRVADVATRQPVRARVRPFIRYHLAGSGRLLPAGWGLIGKNDMV